MKPIRLTIEGINSFIERQTLDFEAVGHSNLFCISGKTGAGKTTIFDSIMLALYGKSTKGNLADVVNLSLMSARVCLDFAENGEVYSVERNIKCRFEKDGDGKKTDKRIAVGDCTLYRNGAPIAKGEEANDIIHGIIGLECAEFKNVYMLEQGEYAEFLKKTPAKQTEAVGKIFSLMRFGDVHKLAGDRAREVLTEMILTETEMSGLGDASPQKLQAEKDAIKSLRAKTTVLTTSCQAKAAELAALEKVRDEYISVCEKQKAVKTLMLQSDEAKKRESAALAALAEFERSIDTAAEQKLKTLRETLNSLSALNSLDREYAATTAEITTKQAVLIKKQDELTAAEKRLAELDEQRQNDRAALAQKKSEFITAAEEIKQKSPTLTAAAESLGAAEVGATELAEAGYKLTAERDKYTELNNRRVGIADRLTAARESAAKTLAVIEQYTQKLNEIAAQKTAAETQVETAKKGLLAAQLCSHAAAVRAELKAGEICPVCGGAYGGAHDSESADVEQKKKELEQAEQELKRIEQAQTQCAKHLDRAKTEYEGYDKAVRSAEAELCEADNALRSACVDPAVYETLIRIVGMCKAAAEKARVSDERWRGQGPEISRLKAERDALSQTLAELNAKADKFGAELGENRGKTDGEIARVKAETAELEKSMNAVDERRKKIKSEADAATAAVAAIESSLAAARADCPVDMPAFDENAYAEKRDELERIKKQIAENERDIAVKDVEINNMTAKCDRLAELTKKIAELKKRADMYDRIAEITRGKAMLNYVAAEYIAEFTSVASEILNELSGGKYTMSYDKTNGFVVYDYLNDGKARKTDTLSGGELFLASLSVAIAIARTQSKGNNAFFFLDEGFGTLDEELIDVVYAALESLSKDCLVGVITHAEALISRMPFCVSVIEATDTSGSRIIQ